MPVRQWRRADLFFKRKVRKPHLSHIPQRNPYYLDGTLVLDYPIEFLRVLECPGRHSTD